MMTTPELELQNYVEEYGRLMRIIFSKIQVADASELLEYEITIPQFMVLNVLIKEDNRKMSDLSAELGVTLGNVTGIIDRMVRENYVQRAEDPADRRIVRVHLTATGKKTAEKIIAAKRKHGLHIFRKISESDRKTLLRIMKEFAKIIEKEEENN